MVAYSFVVTTLLDLMLGGRHRVPRQYEDLGLDQSQHAESAYDQR